MRQQPAAWSKHGLVALCGAGISAPAPSCVPSWWEFNETVLDVIRSRYIDGQPVPMSARPAIDGLLLEQLGVVRFSQLVSDAFAGSTWFRLLRCLDSRAPNPVHLGLARLAADGVLKAVVTTNFDTLLERAFSGTDDAQVLHTIGDSPKAISADGGPLIVKLHGSATRPTTLIDLATQKTRGLPTEWLDWLGDLWSRHAVLVLGFSGADTTFGGDYLRLREAGRLTPWLRWNIRDGSEPTGEAAAIVGLFGPRGGYLVGDLPDVLRRYDVEVARPVKGRLRRRSIAKEVTNWLDRNSGDSGACGVVVARLLRELGQRQPATMIFDGLRVQARAQLAHGVSAGVAAQLTLVLAQAAYDTADQHPRRAIKDLDLALRAYQAVIDGLGGPDKLPPHGRREWASTMAGLHQRLARAHLNLKQHRAAERWNQSAARFFDDMTPADRHHRLTAAAEIDGVAALYGGDRTRAVQRLQLARDLALDAGRPDVAFAIGENLSLIDGDADSPGEEANARRPRGTGRD
jgi:hypothetical protein